MTRLDHNRAMSQIAQVSNGINLFVTHAAAK